MDQKFLKVYAYEKDKEWDIEFDTNIKSMQEIQSLLRRIIVKNQQVYLGEERRTGERRK